MLIKHPFPPSLPALTPAKPQLHTLKNHDTYNGALHLPVRTHVRVSRTLNDPAATTKTNNPDQVSTQYTITLFYAHNRACVVYRSAAAVLTFQSLLYVAGCTPPPPEVPRRPAESVLDAVAAAADAAADSTNSSTTSSSKRKADGGVAPCYHACSCPAYCTCPPQQRADARLARELNQLLAKALGMAEAGKESVRMPVEWFLRRRDGDCGVCDDAMDTASDGCSSDGGW